MTVAKNYLNEEEITELERIWSFMWLDLRRGSRPAVDKQVFLKDWETKLDGFLIFNERAVLHGNARRAVLSRN